MRLFPLRAVTAVGLAFVVSLPAAAENVLEVIPDNALGFVVVNKLDDTNARIISTAQRLRLPGANLLEMAMSAAGVKKGIDAKGSLALAIVPGKDVKSLPVPLLLVPTTDYAAMLKELRPFAGIGQTDGKTSIELSQVRVGDRKLWVGQRGSYAVFTPEGHEILMNVIASTKNITKTVTPVRKFIAEGDVCFVATRSGVQFGAQKVQEGIALAKLFLAKSDETKAAVAAMDMYDAMFKAAEKHVTLCAFSARVDEQGNLHLASRTRFPVDPAVVKSAPGLPEGGLAALAGSPFVFAGGFALPGQGMEGMMRFSVQMMNQFPGPERLTEEQMKKFVNLSIKSMRGVRSMSLSLRVPKPGGGLYDNAASAMSVENSREFLNNYASVLNEMRALAKKTKHPWYMSPEVEKLTLGDLPALKVTASMAQAFGDQPGAEDMREMMKRVFGPDGKMTFYMAPLDDKTVVGAYTSEASLRRVLKAARNRKQGLARDPSVAQTVALLPRGSQWTFYVSPQGTIDLVKQMASAFAPAPTKQEFSRLPSFPESPPVGFAAKLTRQGLETHFVAPAPTLSALGRFIQDVRKSQSDSTAGPVAALDPKQLLGRRVGTWRTETVAKPAEWTPDGHESQGMETIKWTLGDKFIQGDKTVPKDKMQARWLATYDEGAKVFRFWYFDSAGVFPSGETIGRYDAKTQMMRWEADMGEGRHGTGTWRFVNKDALNWTYLVKDQDGKVYIDMTGKQLRVKEPFAAPPVTSRAGSDKRNRVLFTANRGEAKDTFHIYAMDEDGKNIKRLSKGDAMEVDAVFSPDGKRIAFAAITRNKDRGPTSAIFVMNADGSGRKQLTKGDRIATGPMWSPDGKRIAYAAMDGPPRPRRFESTIYMIDADGKNRKELGEGVVPSWSPDGRQIAYSTIGEDGRPSLYLRPVDGGEPKEFVKGIAMLAIWSPDGKRIAYMADGGDDNPDIFVAKADGTDPKQLTKTKDIEMGVAWSSDGKRILFTRADDGQAFEREGADIYSIDLDGKNERRLTRGKAMHLLSGASLFIVGRGEARAEKAEEARPANRTTEKKAPARPKPAAEKPRKKERD